MGRKALIAALVGIPIAGTAVTVGVRMTAAPPPKVVVATRSYDLARTGWNQNEAKLTPASVTPTTFHKVGELSVDDMIEASPLFVGGATVGSATRDLVVVATTNASVYAFDANTREVVWSRALGPGGPPPAGKATVYQRWGITSTPVIDPDTATIFVLRLAMEGPNEVFRLCGLKLADGSDQIQPQLVDGNSVKRDNSNYFVNGQQIVRTALTLWRDAAGNKAVIFGASGGESVNGPHGWVVAYNVARLHAGGNVAPAVWCTSPGQGGAGVWMASQGLVVDESDPGRDIYLATGNGPYLPSYGADVLGESVVRLHYDPAGNTLYDVDWFTPFSDSSHDPNHRDQDLGAAGVLLIPNSHTVLAGGKEGIFYNVDRTNMGKLSHGSLLQPDFVATFTPVPPANYLADTNQATTTDGIQGAGGDGRTFIPNPADGGRTRHVHGGTVFYQNAGQRYVFVMGENSTLRAFQYNGTVLVTTPVAQSTAVTAASGTTAPPGGMPGGFLSVSSADATGTNGIVWSVSPRKSLWRDPAANSIPGPSILRAFNAVPTSGGTLTELWNSEMDLHDAVGNASKFQPPLVADGNVYVPTYDNKVIVYSTTPAAQTARDVRRTMVLIKTTTAPGQDLFIRGGIDQTYGNAHGLNCPTSSPPASGDPTYYNCAIRIEHRNTIDYGGNHEPYPITNRWQVNDRFLDWYGTEPLQTYQRLGPTYQGLGVAQGTPLDWTTSNPSNAAAVIRQGYGFLKENQDAGLGDGYWMLDVDMDCESAITVNGVPWFELKSYLTNVATPWEADVNQTDRPYVSGNHFGQCGRINIFERGSGSVTYRDFDTVNQRSTPGIERSCNNGVAQICATVGSAKVWQIVRDCVQSKQLCQISTGQCCTPTNGFVGSNENCL